jgi:glycosyltransferase involved in cell wall biosynthesis
MANQTRQLHQLLVAEGVRVSLVQTNPVYKPKVIEKYKKIRAFFRLVPYVISLWRLAGEVDVIHVLANSGWSWQLFAAPAVWVGKMRKTPVIVNYRGGEARSYFEKAFKRIRPTLVKGDALIVPSGYLQQVFADFGLKTEIIPNIIDLERFRQRQDRPRPRNLAPHLIITRNLEPIYDIPTAIRAASILRKNVPAFRLSIAGSGPQLGELRELARQLGLERMVTFTGRLLPDEVSLLFSDADIMLNPTTVDNMPNSILEAMASGVPVVTTNVGGIPYVVEDGKTALMVNPGDAEGMAEQILRLLTNPDLYAELAKKGEQEVQQYVWPRVRQQWLGLYGRLADRGEKEKIDRQPNLLVFSSLFPHANAPNNGVFIRERMFRVGEKFPITVVSPQPWFPGQELIRYFRPHFRPRAPKSEVQNGIEVLFPRFLSVPGIFKSFDGLFMALGSYRTLLRISKKKKFNLIDSHFAYPDGYAAGLLGRWLEKPVTITLRGTEVPQSKTRRRRRLITDACERADQVFSVSDSLKQHVVSLGVEPDKIEIIGNGVDTEKFFPVGREEAREQLGLPADAVVLVTVGALVERKGFHRVIDVLPSLLPRFPRLKYLIVGGPGPEGDWSDLLRQKVREMGLEEVVVFLGPKPSEEVRIPLSAADLFVLATGNEGWANVFLEAMACGLPVVTTRVGGNQEVVSSEDLGQLVPFGDSAALQQALIDSLEKPWDRDKIIRYARDNSWDKRVAVLGRAFADLVEKSADRGYAEITTDN